MLFGDPPAATLFRLISENRRQRLEWMEYLKTHIHAGRYRITGAIQHVDFKQTLFHLDENRVCA